MRKTRIADLGAAKRKPRHAFQAAYCGECRIAGPCTTKFDVDDVVKHSHPVVAQDGTQPGRPAGLGDDESPEALDLPKRDVLSMEADADVSGAGDADSHQNRQVHPQGQRVPPPGARRLVERWT